MVNSYKVVDCFIMFTEWAQAWDYDVIPGSYDVVLVLYASCQTIRENATTVCILNC